MGDDSKNRDFLPCNKQYLVMHGIPCLCCTTSLAYIDADKDTEHLLSFADASAPSTDSNECSKTHVGCQAHKTDSATNKDKIVDISKLGGDRLHDNERIVKGLGGMLLGGGGGGEGVGMMETSDLDDIPDIEEDDLEEGDDEATAAVPKVSVIPAAGVLDTRYVIVGWLEIRRVANNFL